EKIGIISVAQTKYHPNRADAKEGEMAYEAIKQVLEETGLKYVNDGTGIDAAVSCSQDYRDGRTISSLNVASFIGTHFRSEEKVADDGINAVFYAMMHILSGEHDTVLVVTHCKESMSSPSLVENHAFDPIFMRGLGLDFLSAAAMQATRYMSKYKITPEQCAQVAVKNRGNARNNPLAQEPMNITVADVLNSKMICDPIRELDAKPVSDGACAMILAREKKAEKFCKKPIWINGVSNCYEAHYLGDRDLADCKALTKAAKKAYKMAGITDPIKDIDVAEISEYYSYQELLWMEGLGLCGRGQAGKLLEGGDTRMNGRLPVNPSGGMLAGNPYEVGGMARVCEAVLQLRGEAGKRQVSGADIALAHGATGICGQLQTVMILSNS
ncbi:MAG: thiolase family protein, partial [Chloroflexota bacterium]|nr:thiolase family protein [Chloroflexota bacterium]